MDIRQWYVPYFRSFVLNILPKTPKDFTREKTNKKKWSDSQTNKQRPDLTRDSGTGKYKLLL